LDFTENELANFFKQQGVNVDTGTVREVYDDTLGWAFAVNLAVISLKRVPKYAGFVKTRLKPNIFEFMESESWVDISDELKRFLVRLSLIDRLCAKLVYVLADGNEKLLSELRQQNSYIVFDEKEEMFSIHHLYLEFLCSKQGMLEHDEKIAVYKTAADWNKINGCKTDALRLYEKAGDYHCIVSVLWESYEDTQQGVLICASGIFERAPAQVFVNIDYMAAFHLYTLIYLGCWQEFFKTVKVYEQRFLSLSANETVKDCMLGTIYYLWGSARFLLSTIDGCYDFDLYYTKAANHWIKSPQECQAIQKIVLPIGSYVTTLGSTDAKALGEYSRAVKNSSKELSICNGGIIGFDYLYQGELKFYQNDLEKSEFLLTQSIKLGRKYRQFETVHRALFYIMRIAIIQGDRAKADRTLKDFEELLNETDYSRCNTTYDIVTGWYYCFIRQFNIISDWLKGEFVSCTHPHSFENLSNQIRARYYFLRKDYLPLLSYINIGAQ